MIPTRTTADLLLGMWMLLQLLGRVPRRLIWDNETGVGRGKRHAEGVSAFTGTLATTLQRLKANDPESKGVVERRNGYYETSFMPGREFASPADFNIQFGQWLTIANARVVRTIKVRPVDLLDADRAAMLPLPPVPPAVGWVNRVRLGRDYYVRIDSNDYSVDPAVIGRFVDVTADLSTRRGPPPRTSRRHPRPGLGTRHDTHRPRPRRSRQGAARTVPTTANPGRCRRRSGSGPGRLRPRVRPHRRDPD
ncbi:MAG: hypothetical protein V9F04_11335 [Dermatophilaceae bacterium]